MKRVLAVLALALAFEANACGICIDDKIASCYDHALVTGAKAKGHAVAFFAIQGALPHDEATRAMLRKALQTTPGVLRGSGRVSVESAALSFAYDPVRGDALAIARRLERRLAAGLSVALLRVM